MTSIGIDSRKDFTTEVRSLLSFLLPHPDEALKNKNCSEDLMSVLFELYTLMFEPEVMSVTSLDESYYANKYQDWLYTKIYKYPQYINLIKESKYKVHFPEFKNLHPELPDCITLLKSFYEDNKNNLDKGKNYYKAIKERLFWQLFRDARTLYEELNKIENLNSLPDKAQDTILKSKDFLSLAVHSLYPIILWNFESEDRDKDKSQAAKIKLKKLGGMLNPTRVGHKRGIPLLYQTALCIVYDTVLAEFNSVTKKHNLSIKKQVLKKGLTGLISDENTWNFSREPYKDAKEITSKSFNVNEKDLNKYLSTKNRKEQLEYLTELSSKLNKS